MATKDDLLFGNIAARKGLAKSEHINLCLQIQASDEAANAPKRTLGQIMVERGYITPVQVELVLDEQRRLSAPKLVGPYQVIAKLGEGGMGAVYKALVPATGLEVALKVLPKKHADNASFITRFKREAEAGIALEHPHIVRMFDVGDANGIHFMAMELVEGGDLRKKLKERGVFSEREALEIARDVALALQHAHEKGMIHRDVKPDNIMFSKEGRAKLSDFGLVKFTDPEAAHLTQSGATVGTPHYIAPEQARGEKDLDIRVDIYALGGTLYHLVTGRTPFVGSSAFEIVNQHLTATLTPPDELNSGLSDGCVAVIEKMLAKDREDRYHAPSDVVADLERVLRGEEPTGASLDEGKSSVQISAKRKAKVQARGVPRRSTGQQVLPARRATEGPLKAVREAPREGQAPAEPSSAKRNVYVFAGAGAGVLLLLVFLVASLGGESPPEKKKADLKTPAPPAPPGPSGPVAPTPAPQNKEREAQAAFDELSRFAGIDASNKAARAARIEEFLVKHGDSIVASRARAMLEQLKAPAPQPLAAAKDWSAEWTFVGKGTDVNPSHLLGDFNGRTSVWQTHPDGDQITPAKWTRKLKLEAGQKPVLRLDVSAVGNRDWVLVACANGQELLNKVILGTAWQPIAVDLSAFAGQEVTLELWNKAGGQQAWDCEHGYWDRVRIENDAANRTNAGFVYLGDLPASEVRGTWQGQFWKKGKINDQNLRISVNGKESPNGIFLHPAANSSSHVSYCLDKPFRFFAGAAALNDSAEKSESPLTFRILGDGRSLWQSKPIQASKQPQDFELDITGIKKLELMVECPGPDSWAHAVWIEPRLLPAENTGLTRGLIGHWMLDESQGSVAKDASGNGHDGKIVGDVKWVDGKFGKALAFDGDGDWLGLPDRLIAGNNSISISAWFKTTAHGVILGYQNKMVQEQPGSYVPSIYVGSDGRLRAGFWHNLQDKIKDPDGIVKVNDDTWHHVALCTGQGKQQVYLDGKVCRQIEGDPNYRDMHLNQIGTGFSQDWPNTNSQWFGFKGFLDDVRIYNRALSDEEVKALYEGKTAATPATVSDAWRKIFDGTTTNGFTMDSKQDWEVRNGALVNRNTGKAAKTAAVFADGEVRIVFEIADSDYFYLAVRQGSAGKAFLEFEKNLARTLAGKPHELIFSCAGEQVKAKLDGNPVEVKVYERVAAEGAIQFSARNGTLAIRGIEFRGLEGLDQSQPGEAAWANAIDLLKLVDPKADAVKGKWELKDGGVCSDETMHARIEIPYRSPEEYDFRITFSRLSGNEAVSQFLSHSKASFLWMMGGGGNTIFGFEVVGGKEANNNPTTVKSPRCLENGQRYISVVQVRKTGIKAFLNGQLVSSWKPEFGALDVHNFWKLRDGSLLGLGSWKSSTQFYKAEVLEVTGKGEVLRQAGAITAPETTPPLVDKQGAKDAIHWETWNDIGGGTVANLTQHPNFPLFPSETNELTSFETPANRADNYGSRMCGYIHPPLDGDYIFWIASDDEGELWLSTDAGRKNIRRIAEVRAAKGVREWEKDGGQKSAAIALKAGQKYYLEALQKDAGGPDHLAVGWQLPNGTQERPIPGTRLSPRASAKWVTLDITSTSAGNIETKFIKQKDGSMLVAGTALRNDTYSIGTRPNLKNIVAVRLEVLPDDSLPGKGPGRADNGNFVLTDFKLAVDGRLVVLQNPRADYSQSDLPVAGVLDDKKDTGWGVGGQTGKPHAAVFELAKPFNAVALGFVLAHESKWPNYNIGRFRLSVALDEAEKP